LLDAQRLRKAGDIGGHPLRQPFLVEAMRIGGIKFSASMMPIDDGQTLQEAPAFALA
jgi:hypothetical protein